MKEPANPILDLAVRIQQIPAPTFKERARAEFVRQLFAAEGLDDVAMDDVCNVYARLPGRQRQNPLVVSAHLDTVFAGEHADPLHRQQGRLYGAGIGDNSLGVAALFGLVWSLRDHRAPPSADIWLVANTGEEGLGNLRGMRRVVERFGQAPRVYLVIEGTAFGQVYHRGIGVRRYRVSLSTSGGHSWSDYGKPSAIHEMADLVTQIAAIPTPSEPRTTLNVGVISGGSGVNVIASHAEFELDARSETPEGLHEIICRVEERMRAAVKKDVEVDIQVTGERPAGVMPPDHPLVRLAGECVLAQGLQPTFTSGSTDANIPLSLGIPSLVLGVTTGGGAHTAHEYIDVAPIPKGMQHIVDFVERVLETHA
jgi:tripeptide aminopeptidase